MNFLSIWNNWINNWFNW